MGKGTDATEGTDETSAHGRVASSGAPRSLRASSLRMARLEQAPQKRTREVRTDRPDQPFLIVEGGRKVLRVGGVIQSVHVDDAYEPDVWDVMLPDARPERALILGLGGGTMAQLLTARFGPIEITGVERDPTVIWLARHEFGLAALPHVHIVAGDAFAFVHDAAERNERFDAICVDLYTAGKMAHGVLDPAFLRDLAGILSSAGAVTFNLWRSRYLADQLRRLGRALRVDTIMEVEDNFVVRCTPL